LFFLFPIAVSQFLIPSLHFLMSKNVRSSCPSFHFPLPRAHFLVFIFQSLFSRFRFTAPILGSHFQSLLLVSIFQSYFLISTLQYPLPIFISQHPFLSFHSQVSVA
jgi:hypothetical protein